MILQGKIAIVTGGGGAIGNAVCRKLAAMGAMVAVGDVDLDKAGKTVAAITDDGGNAFAVRMDVTDTLSVNSAVEEVISRCGKVDILVNNAGGSAGLKNELTLFKDAREEIWQWVIDLNLCGTMRCTRAVLNGMIERKYGRIINISSIAATAGLKLRCDYSAAKAGVLGFTKALAMEIGESGVTVNAILPGLISREPEWLGKVRPSERNYLGRWGMPEELASAVAYFASDEAGYITGADLTVDGGRTLGCKEA